MQEQISLKDCNPAIVDLKKCEKCEKYFESLNGYTPTFCGSKCKHQAQQDGSYQDLVMRNYGIGKYAHLTIL